MNHIQHLLFEGPFCGDSRDQGGLAILDHVVKNFPGACGVKLVQRIADRPLRVARPGSGCVGATCRNSEARAVGIVLDDVPSD